MNLKRLNAIAEKGENILAKVAIVVLCLIIFSVCLEIFMRYFLNRPLVWVVELTEYALLWVTFLGAPWLLGQEGHVRVDVIVNFMSERWKNRWAVFGSALGLMISVILTIFGAIVTFDHWLRDIYKPTVLEFPTWIVLVAIPLGSIFLVIRFLKLMLDHIVVLFSEKQKTGKET
jgi:TRAP-type C4-dicarboxylate transport system permease small subunit